MHLMKTVTWYSGTLTALEAHIISVSGLTFEA
jgi:hypothetical protein